MANKRITPYAKIARLKEMVEFLVLKHEPICFFCEEVITINDLMQGHRNDLLTIHHVDFDRSNNGISNRVLTHRSCHARYHRRKEIREGKRSAGTSR